MTDFTFIRLYLPADGRTTLKPSRDGSILINQDCVNWLNENIGPRALSYQQWIVSLPSREYGWYYKGFEYDPATNSTKISRCFCFHSEQQALMFKLAWGGN